MVRLQRNVLAISLSLAVFSATISALFGIPNVHIPMALLFVVIGVWLYGFSNFELLILIFSLINIFVNGADFQVSNWLFMMGYLTIIVYSSLMKEWQFEVFQSVLLKLAIVVLIGQVINLFVDRSIFGLIGGSIYSDESISFDSNFTQRGISFITSPQSLSLFYLVVAFVALRVKNNVGLIVAVLGAILTGSKYSMFAIVLVFIGMMLQTGNRWLKWAIMPVGIAGLIVFSDSEFIGRIFSALSLFSVEAMQDYSAYVIWADSFMQVKSDFVHLFVGSYPFGFSSRIYQNINGGLLYGSTESTAISWLLDGGLLFILLLVYRIFKVARYQALITKVFVAFCFANILFTPALYSSLTPLFVFPFLFNSRLH